MFIRQDWNKCVGEVTENGYKIKKIKKFSNNPNNIEVEVQCTNCGYTEKKPVSIGNLKTRNNVLNKKECNHSYDLEPEDYINKEINKYKILAPTDKTVPHGKKRKDMLFLVKCKTCGYIDMVTLDTIRNSNENTKCNHKFWFNSSIRDLFYYIHKNYKVVPEWGKTPINYGYRFQEYLFNNTKYTTNPNGKIVIPDPFKPVGPGNFDWDPVPNVEIYSNSIINNTINNNFYLLNVCGNKFDPYRWDAIFQVMQGYFYNYCVEHGPQATCDHIYELGIQKHIFKSHTNNNLINPVYEADITYI